MNKGISFENISSFEKDFSDKSVVLARRAVAKNGISNSAIDEKEFNKLQSVYSHSIDAGSVCNQKQSGRCWMFAGLNVIRVILAKKLGVKNIELSQAYLQFFDKLEKFNFSLEKAIELADEPIDSRLNVFILDNGLGDGGHFVMFTNLVKKYGVVPSDFQPDNAVNCATSEFNQILESLLCQDIHDLRQAKKDGKSLEQLRAMKEKMLEEVHRILVITLGEPVKEFQLEYTDKDNKFVRLPKLSPKQFYDSYIGKDLDDYVVLTDAPLLETKPYQKYTCSYVNNVIDGDPVIFFNVSPDEFKLAVVSSIKGGDPVWFGADVRQQSLRKEGKLGGKLLRTDELLGYSLHLSKGDRLSYRNCFCNHAMTFTGVNLLDNGVANRFKVENSWGKENGKDGFYDMDEVWFDNFVYEVFVDKKYISEELLKKYQASDVKEVSPFDAMWANMD